MGLGLGPGGRTLAAGGKQQPWQVEVADLAQVTHDPLLAQLRNRLRKFHQAPREGKPLGVACVFSREAVAKPHASCGLDENAAPGAGGQALNCAGYGSFVGVTASFGMAAAGWVLDGLAA